MPAVRARATCGDQGGNGSMNDGGAPIPLSKIAWKKVPQVATMKSSYSYTKTRFPCLQQKDSKMVILKLFEPAFAV